MAGRFSARRDGTIAVHLEEPERLFLLDLVAMLRSVPESGDDPASRRLDVPVYLGDERANEEWRRLVGDQIQEGRNRDRETITTLLTADPPVTLGPEEALEVLRVINEARLVLAARLGVEVEADYESLGIGETMALHMLGLLLEDLTEELTRSLG